MDRTPLLSLLAKPLILILLLLPLLQACQNTPAAVTSPNEPNVETLAVASVTAGVHDQSKTDTSQRMQVTATPASTSQPVLPSPIPEPVQIGVPISPTQGANTSDMLRVAYLQGQDISLWTEAGGSRQLTRGEQVHQLRISPDGQMVAYTRGVDPFHEELWIIGTDGSGERRLVGMDEFSAIDPHALAVVPATFEWIPGTHLLAFNTRQVVEGPGSAMYNDLHLANADSGQIQTLLAPGHGGQFFPSPDGRQIALTSPSSLSLINVDGTNLRQNVLDYAPITTYSEYQYYAQPVWRTDSSSLLVAIPPPDPLAIPLPPTTLWQVPVDGTKAKQIGKIATGPFFGMDVFYSPDRGHILFLDSSGNPDQNLQALHIARPDGSQDTVYTTAAALTISAWAPDSQHFTFSLGNPGVLQLAQIGGKFQALLGPLSNLVDFRWVDNEHFVYVRPGADGYEIHLSNLQGQDVLLGTTQAFQSIYDFAR
jgi:hypothetical protein